MARPKSTAKRADDAFKALEELRERYRLPHLAGPEDVTPELREEMEAEAVARAGDRGKRKAWQDGDRLRAALRTITDALGMVPRGATHAEGER